MLVYFTGQQLANNMADVIYYDENPSVRALVTQIMRNAGLGVVELASLNDVEAALSETNSGVNDCLLLLDLSSQAHALRHLQEIVPKYLLAPARCILTTVNPSALASHLPSNVDDAFFKHVVERPFKRLAFIDFLQEVLPGARIAESNLHAEHHSERTNKITPKPSPIPSSLPIASSISEVVLRSRDSNLVNDDFDDEAESTDVISPDLTRELLASAGSEYVSSSGQERVYLSALTSVETLSEVFLLIYKRRLNCVFEQITQQNRYIAFFSSGQLRWLEKCPIDSIPSLGESLEKIPDFHLISAESRNAIISESQSSIDAVITAHKLSDFFDTKAAAYFTEILAEILRNAPAEFNLYRSNQSAYDELMTQRPALNLALSPMLFDFYRRHTDSIIVPYYVSYLVYTARRNRTPQNQFIELSDQEEFVLRFLRSPFSYRDLKARRIAGALEILHRLSLFEFIDEVCQADLVL